MSGISSKRGASSKRKHFAKWRVDLAIHEALDLARKRAVETPFGHLLSVVLSQSTLLQADPIGGWPAWRHIGVFLRGLLALSEYHKSWLHQPDQWDPAPGHSILDYLSPDYLSPDYLRASGRPQQFTSLARHLLADHPVPNFMTWVWLLEPSQTACAYQKLYKHLGLGNSIRGAAIPLRLTKVMANFFMQAPDHLSVEQALRWSHVRGLGGDPAFAKEVLSTQIGTKLEYQAFWTEVIQFLLNRPGLDLAMVAPIIEFLDFHRREAARPSLRMLSHRRFGAFLSGVRRWMERRALGRNRPMLSWSRTKIAGLELFEPQRTAWSVRYWTIRELTDSRQLLEEGRTLRHCVASYTGICAGGKTSIWSLRRHGSLQSQRLLTIEVDPKTRTIVTARGHCNASPQPDVRRIMEIWAQQAHLSISRWV